MRATGDEKEAIEEQLEALGASIADSVSFQRPLWAAAIAAGMGAGLSLDAAAAVAGIPPLNDIDRAELTIDIAAHHVGLVKQQASAIAAIQTAALALYSLRLLTNANLVPPTVLPAALTSLVKARLALQSDASSFTPISITVAPAAAQVRAA